MYSPVLHTHFCCCKTNHITYIILHIVRLFSLYFINIHNINKCFKYMSFQVVQTQQVTYILTSSAVQCDTERQYIWWQNYEYLCTFILIKKSLTYPLHSESLCVRQPCKLQNLTFCHSKCQCTKFIRCDSL
jgi:hypothetical protein